MQFVVLHGSFQWCILTSHDKDILILISDICLPHLNSSEVCSMTLGPNPPWFTACKGSIIPSWPMSSLKKPSLTRRTVCIRFNIQSEVWFLPIYANILIAPEITTDNRISWKPNKIYPNTYTCFHGTRFHKVFSPHFLCQPTIVLFKQSW